MERSAPREPRDVQIRYLVHDLSDPAVERRRRMLEAGGAVVRLAGFQRVAEAPLDPNVTSLGRTYDADLLQRVRAVGRWLARPTELAALARDQDVILARNLEMLLLAVLARRLRRSRARLVYECLDIHTVLLGNGLKSRALRALEGLLLKQADSLIISAPAFVTEHFGRRRSRLPRVLLVENRLLRLDAPEPAAPRRDRRAGDPWRIGWFGMIRCRKSLDLLTSLAASLPGKVEVVIRGRPSPAVFENLPQEVSGLPGVRFCGPYGPEELPDAYREVDFVWAVDYHEAGLNSAWLLPNRLYEGGAFNRPALALREVETGKWLEARGSGVVLEDMERDLAPFLRGLTEEDYAQLSQKVERVPRTDLICGRADCVDLVRALAG